MSLFIHSMLRLFFFLYNQNSFQDATVSDVIAAHVWGLRYDISTLMMLNSLFILLMFIPQKALSFIKINTLKILFFLQVAVNALSIFTQIYDSEYFRFTGQRLTPEIFSMGKDIGDQWVQLVQNYWLLSLFAIAITFIFIIISRKVLESMEAS